MRGLAAGASRTDSHSCQSTPSPAARAGWIRKTVAPAEQRAQEVPPEVWEQLPHCVRLCGIAPNDRERLPPEYRGDDEAMDLVVQVQHKDPILKWRRIPA